MLNQQLIELNAIKSIYGTGSFLVEINGKNKPITSIKFYDTKTNTVICTSDKGVLYSNCDMQNKEKLTQISILPYVVYTDENDINSIIEQGMNNKSNFVVFCTNKENFYSNEQVLTTPVETNIVEYQCILFLAIDSSSIKYIINNTTTFNVLDTTEGVIYKNNLTTYVFNIDGIEATVQEMQKIEKIDVISNEEVSEFIAKAEQLYPNISLSSFDDVKAIMLMCNINSSNINKHPMYNDLNTIEIDELDLYTIAKMRKN